MGYALLDCCSLYFARCDSTLLGTYVLKVDLSEFILIAPHEDIDMTFLQKGFIDSSNNKRSITSTHTRETR